MNRNIVALSSALFLLLTSSGVGQQKATSPSESRDLITFIEVKGTPEHLPSSFEFSTSSYKYRVKSNGQGRRSVGKVSSRPFNLRLDKDESLDRVIYYAEYQNDLVLICEVSLGDGGAGFITRLDGRTLRMKWKRWIPGFNVGQGLIEDDFAYVTAHSFVGKVNLKSGAFVWKHGSLFRDGDTFNAFELPRVDGEAVLFKEETTYNPPAKTIKVHKQSGKIMSIG